ncbi:MAG: lytic murein transglycosylase B [Pseudomonadota bacterium]
MQILLGALLLTLSLALQAQDAAQLQETFIQDMVQQHGFNAEALRQLLDEADIQPPVLDKMSKAAEKRLDWGRYQRIFLTESRIQKGVAYWQKHQALLQRAETTYGVPAQIIVAILGIETNYGQNTGKHSVLKALATLGFHHPRRGKFFRGELNHFLRLARTEQLDPYKPRGSYAGAMGQPQFIPSSYQHFAIDFDGDGKRDIWHTSADVIGSVAHYLAKHHWQPDQAVTLPIQNVNPDKHAKVLQAGYKPHTTIAELRASGIRIPDTVDAQQTASLLTMRTDDQAEYWLGLPNFYAITRYNHSPLYAMAVYQLSESIREHYLSD